MSNETAGIKFPEEPQRLTAGRYGPVQWVYGEHIGDINEVGRVYERDCKELALAEVVKLQNVVNAAKSLTATIEEYQKARAAHASLLEYSTDFEVSSDRMQRSATELEESREAMTKALAAFWALSEETAALEGESIVEMRCNAKRYGVLRDLAMLRDPYDQGASISSWNWTIELETGCSGGIAPPHDAPTFDELVDREVAKLSNSG